MSKLRDAAQQALEALETVLYDAYHRRFLECCGRPGSECCGNPNEAWAPEDNKIMDALSPAQRQLSDALRAALAEPCEMGAMCLNCQPRGPNGECPDAPQPEREPVEATPYNLKRIAWELERTAVGDGFYGNALRVAKDMPGITPKDRSVLDRYATGTQTGTDHVHLQWLAQWLYTKDERATKAPQLKAEPQEPVAWKHDCAALLTNDVELWIDACPHCGKPRPAPQPKPAEQEPVRGEWQGYTWNPYAVSQPKAEPLTNLEGLKLAYNHHWINNLSLRDAFLQGIRDAEAAHGITKTSPRSKT